jgi:hypothetical protein
MDELTTTSAERQRARRGRQDQILPTIQDARLLRSTVRWIYRVVVGKLGLPMKGIEATLLASLLENRPSNSGDRQAFYWQETDNIWRTFCGGKDRTAAVRASSLRTLLSIEEPRATRLIGILKEVVRDKGESLSDYSSVDHAFVAAEQRAKDVIHFWINHKEVLRAASAFLYLANLYRTNYDIIPKASLAVAEQCLDAADHLLRCVPHDHRAEILKHHILIWRLTYSIDKGQFRTAEKRLPALWSAAGDIGTSRIQIETNKFVTRLYSAMGKKSQMRKKGKYIEKAERALEDAERNLFLEGDVSTDSKVGLWHRRIEMLEAKGEAFDESAALADLFQNWLIRPCYFRKRTVKKLKTFTGRAAESPYMTALLPFIYDSFPDWIEQ